MPLDSVPAKRPVERCPAAAQAETGDFGQLRRGPQVRIVGPGPDQHVQEPTGSTRGRAHTSPPRWTSTNPAG